MMILSMLGCYSRMKDQCSDKDSLHLLWSALATLFVSTLVNNTHDHALIAILNSLHTWVLPLISTGFTCTHNGI